MKLIPTALPEVFIIEPRVFGDERGYFFESWHGARHEAAGLPSAYVQDNLSYSEKGVIRGLHFQNPHAQGMISPPNKRNVSKAMMLPESCVAQP